MGHTPTLGQTHTLVQTPTVATLYIIVAIVYSRPRLSLNQVTVLIVVSVVYRFPISSADVAKLVAAAAGHVVATLVLLDNKPTSFASTVMQVLLEKFHFFLVAVS